MTRYVTCPRCAGQCQVMAYTTLPTPYTAARAEYFACPLCHGTGETDEDAAQAWQHQRPQET